MSLYVKEMSGGRKLLVASGWRLLSERPRYDLRARTLSSTPTSGERKEAMKLIIDHAYGREPL